MAVGLSAQASDVQSDSAQQAEPSQRPTPEQTPAATVIDEPTSYEATEAVAVDPLSPSYNPYTDPASPDYVTPEAKAAWYAKDAVVGTCMTDLGLGYVTAPWWTGGTGPQPTGLDYNQSIEWLIGYYGENYMQPTGVPEESGCSGLGILIDDGALAAPPVPVPADPVGLPTERETWLAFQELVRGCMTEKGFEYLYWEWWNPEYQTPFDPLATEPAPDPAQPEGLSEEQLAAWGLALGGDAGLGGEYRWEDAGCWGYAVHASGNDNMH
ncbi:hypothetical protein [Microterricola gilva]|uniref:hypothetical protein n=1 Tax=Microterricola gilva TaxID=393267 RepID=UPI00102C1320|nr:hypothetical protein [Microterricola gilva]